MLEPHELHALGASPEPRLAERPPSPGKIVFWCFLAALVLLLVWQFFEIQNNCALHKAYDDWQSTFC